VIAVDTSALMAIVLHEPDGVGCITALKAEDRLLISAGTVTEALIVAQRSGRDEQMRSLIDGLGFEVVPVTDAAARRAAAAHGRWGKGARSAGLNFGDCFAYEAAKQHSCRLLYVGNDFSRTDIKNALKA